MRFSRRILGVLAVMLSIFVTMPVFAETLSLEEYEISIVVPDDYIVITEDDYNDNELYKSVSLFFSENLNIQMENFEMYKRLMLNLFDKGGIMFMFSANKKADLTLYAIYDEKYKEFSDYELNELCTIMVEASAEENKKAECEVVTINSNKYNKITTYDSLGDQIKYNISMDGVSYTYTFYSYGDDDLSNEFDKIMKSVEYLDKKNDESLNENMSIITMVVSCFIILVGAVIVVIALKRNK